MPPKAAYSIVEQYAARKQRAKESWAWHMLFACIPFSLLIWGPKGYEFLEFAAFGIIGGMGVRRQFKIDRCPACDAPRMGYNILGRRYVPHPRVCDNCGVDLVVMKP